ncbi:hypothetical protein [Thermoactinomyces sp. DSM 45892]|uniref:hypothetical protein n=1 Tax=Thermoactinomyces sp. DSM 45892 TaxID=1882753 RepID=UPI00089C59B5|nr:hypothetical protein [Thermoactinomyces sp. DSM 45892]SDY85272.1 hypothetical protein SAMN05444416_10976 [Thermoactinomyces sp. DSM 45892]
MNKMCDWCRKEKRLLEVEQDHLFLCDDCTVEYDREYYGYHVGREDLNEFKYGRGITKSE